MYLLYQLVSRISCINSMTLPIHFVSWGAVATFWDRRSLRQMSLGCIVCGMWIFDKDPFLGIVEMLVHPTLTSSWRRVTQKIFLSSFLPPQAKIDLLILGGGGKMDIDIWSLFLLLHDYFFDRQMWKFRMEVASIGIMKFPRSPQQGLVNFPLVQRSSCRVGWKFTGIMYVQIYIRIKTERISISCRTWQLSQPIHFGIYDSFIHNCLSCMWSLTPPKINDLYVYVLRVYIYMCLSSSSSLYIWNQAPSWQYILVPNI